MTQPQGYESGDGSLVCKLTKALYGLKQAPRAQYHKLFVAFQQLGFKSTKSNLSLLTRIIPSSTTYVLINVVDTVVIGSSS